MTERPDKTRLQDWLDDTVGQTPDPVEGTRQVMSRIEETPQVGRWLPLSLLRRKAGTKTRTTTDQTTDYRSTAIAATNGRSPTVIGRTQSMLSPAKAITAGAIVFAIGGVMLIAQPFEQQGSVPGAAIDPCTSPITQVTGDILWGQDEPNPEYLTSTGGVHIRDFVYLSTMEVDDDRLDGQTTGAVDWDLADDMTAGVNQGTFRIDNEEGAWEGTWTGIGGNTVSWQAILELTGTGAYEGLSARLFTRSGATGLIEGSVYPTDIASCDLSTGK